MRKLTIGMVTYDDFHGVYFSIQAIRAYHREILNDVEFIIIDNNPSGSHGETVKGFCGWIKEPHKYIPFTEYKSTALRSKIFEEAKTPYVLVMDCHVMFEQGSLKKLIDFYDSGKDGGNLLQGPMLYDDFVNLSTHFNLNWRAQMWGTWATDERGKDPNGEPFEIPAQGLGAFSCRKDSWLGFNPKFRGFGGEEGYIHEKYRKAGKKTLCLPFLRWIHRFGRPDGVKYPLLMELKVKNYVTGFNEIGLDTKQIYDHFKEFTSLENLNKWFTEAGDGLSFIKTNPTEPVRSELKSAWLSDFNHRLSLNMESVAGYGSSLQETKYLREELPATLKSLNVRSMLDIPCADFFWMSRVNLDGIEYIGADLLEEQIEMTRKLHPNNKFMVLNMIEDTLPKTDLIFTRDLFIHLSLSNIIKCIQNAKRSGATYIMASTYLNVSSNEELNGITGWRFLNLQLAPFDLGTPVRVIDEKIHEKIKKIMGVWKLSDINI